MEEKIGTMLPCNVIVLEKDNGQVEVAGVDPVASMQGIANPHLQDIALQIQAKLKKVIENL